MPDRRRYRTRQRPQVASHRHRYAGAIGARLRERAARAIAARNRLRALLAEGYRLRPSGRSDPHGRILVDIDLPDGRDVSRILLDEGLAQKWPNRGNVWCDRYTQVPARKRG